MLNLGLCLVFVLTLLNQEIVSLPNINLPRELLSLQDGIKTYPPRQNRPALPAKNHVRAPDNICPYTPTDATNLLGAIDKIVNSFYAKNYEKIDMRSDGGVGLGVLKGQINYLLATREDKFSPKFKEFLGQLHSISGQLALNILDQAITATTDASIKLGASVIRKNSHILQARSRDWIDFNKISQYFPEFTNIGEDKEVVHPFQDFHCVVSLLKDCTISNMCQKMHLTDIHSQTMLMRQVMFQQFAERRSCINVNQEAFGNAQEYRNRLCAKAYLEAEFLEKNGFPTKYADLFAEQVGFCGLLGYPNFMRADWLREILSLQTTSASGCVLDLYDEGNAHDVVFADFKNDNVKIVKEPCLVHLTSVSLMALSLNLRYMVDTCAPNIFDGHFN